MFIYSGFTIDSGSTVLPATCLPLTIDFLRSLLLLPGFYYLPVLLGLLDDVWVPACWIACRLDFLPYYRCIPAGCIVSACLGGICVRCLPAIGLFCLPALLDAACRLPQTTAGSACWVPFLPADACCTRRVLPAAGACHLLPAVPAFHRFTVLPGSPATWVPGSGLQISPA